MEKSVEVVTNCFHYCLKNNLQVVGIGLGKRTVLLPLLIKFCLSVCLSVCGYVIHITSSHEDFIIGELKWCPVRAHQQLPFISRPLN